MVYYRVLPKFDNRVYPVHTRKGLMMNYKGFVIGNELVTERELRKRAIPRAWVEEVELSTRKTYFFFGARFEL